MGHDEGWAGQGVGRRPQQVGVGCSDQCLGILEYIAIAALIFGDFVPNILIPRVETHTDPISIAQEPIRWSLGATSATSGLDSRPTTK